MTAARKARDVAKLKKSEGCDPLQARKVEKLAFLHLASVNMAFPIEKPE
ncbi:MAG: hypothetical protein JJD98_07050 [Polaromonas sp.]|nr:hypothetical protein [Polaromonas sp.]